MQLYSIQFIALRWLSACLEKGDFIEPGAQFILKPQSTVQTKDENTKNEVNATSEKMPEKGHNQRPNENLTQTFVCAHSSDESQKNLNHNEIITNELSKLASTYKNSNDQWRCYAYEKAIAAIKRHPSTISTREGENKYRTLNLIQL